MILFGSRISSQNDTHVRSPPGSSTSRSVFVPSPNKDGQARSSITFAVTQCSAGPYPISTRTCRTRRSRQRAGRFDFVVFMWLLSRRLRRRGAVRPSLTFGVRGIMGRHRHRARSSALTPIVPGLASAFGAREPFDLSLQFFDSRLVPRMDLGRVEHRLPVGIAHPIHPRKRRHRIMASIGPALFFGVIGFSHCIQF